MPHPHHTEHVIQQQSPNDFLTTLPHELLFQILSNLTSREVQTLVAPLSKTLHQFAHENIIQSAYGQTLRFIKEHHNTILALEKEINSYKSKYTVRIFNRPDETLVAKIIYYILISTFVFMMRERIINDIACFSTAKQGMKENNTCYPNLSLTVAGSSIFILSLIAVQMSGISITNQRYMKSTINQNHIDELIKRINPYQDFLPEDFQAIRSLTAGSKTIEQVFAMLDNLIKTMKGSDQVLLKFINEFSYQLSKSSQLNDSHFKKLESSQNAHNVLSFWAAKYKTAGTEQIEQSNTLKL